MSQILSSKNVITRTEHVCFGCGRNHPPKTEMRRNGVQDGGTMFTCYLCETCCAITQNMRDGDEFGFGDLREDALEIEAAEQALKECEENE